MIILEKTELVDKIEEIDANISVLYQNNGDIDVSAEIAVIPEMYINDNKTLITLLELDGVLYMTMRNKSRKLINITNKFSIKPSLNPDQIFVNNQENLDNFLSFIKNFVFNNYMKGEKDVWLKFEQAWFLRSLDLFLK